MEWDRGPAGRRPQGMWLGGQTETNRCASRQDHFRPSEQARPSGFDNWGYSAKLPPDLGAASKKKVQLGRFFGFYGWLWRVGRPVEALSLADASGFLSSPLVPR